MGKLQVLPAQLANMIAAGEVVQRPSSVVKELVENAVDSGADRIDVIISDSGRTLIQVIDNGCGMSASDAVLCFERHATSKIATSSDLEAIMSYGFRGEALASIAAVAEVTLKTRREQDESGTQVVIGDSGKLRSSGVSTPKGSNFIIRNLFYNTPARRKFLKGDNVELRHIVDEFVHIAVPHPEIAFSLVHNGRQLYVLKKAKSLKYRIMDVMGMNVADTLVDLSAQTSELNVSGFIGTPRSAKKTQVNQLFFVRGRFFRSPYLHKAVMKAYEEMIPEGVTPAYFIFLDADPSAVDVNVSPTKTEIKFQNESIVFQIIYACVKETLGRNSFGASLDFESEGSIDIPIIGDGFAAYRDANPLTFGGGNPNFNPFDPDSSLPPSGSTPSGNVSGQFFPDSGSSSGGSSGGGAGLGADASGASGGGQAGRYQDYPPRMGKDQSYGVLFESKCMSNTLVLHKRFILTPVASGLMLVNCRRAFERILYERMLKALSSNNHVSQKALFPVQVQIGVQERLILEGASETLERLGFDITPFGTDSVVVNAVPEGMSCEEGKVRTMLDDIVAVLSEPGSGLQEVLNQRMAARFAALGAASFEIGSDPMAPRRLIDTLFACENAELTPGGRKIVAIVGIDEIENKF
ncbi:MAG: DNA mismatch repair endonuclease MutL [Bacteroidales bacterium]|nr:DNA mismatch repair endonuclease MutL [Bacteroidales bacterium]MDD6751815.1 DNA mismatch repair endonuclease MutL [Bacteroidales bacterium]